MLFVLDSIHESLQDDREQYRTMTQLPDLRELIACVSAARCEFKLQVNMQARTAHVALAAAGVIDMGSYGASDCCGGCYSYSGIRLYQHPIPTHPSPQQRIVLRWGDG